MKKIKKFQKVMKYQFFAWNKNTLDIEEQLKKCCNLEQNGFQISVNQGFRLA